MVRVKICGITSEKDARCAVELGAWALGFVFYKKSPRYIDPAKAKKIIAALPPFVAPVGIFVNERDAVIMRTAEFCDFKTIQLHGDETPGFCRMLSGYKIIKAFRVGRGFKAKMAAQYKVDAFLFDTHEPGAYGGTGKTFNWSKLKNKKFSRPVILSGGLNAKNIKKAVAALKPYAVDVSSGVENSPGKKDEKLLKRLFRELNYCKR